MQTIDTKAAAFETVNGESVAIFYNPSCRNDSESGTESNENASWFFIQNRMCANFVYDLNGTKGPNKVGRDIGFITALYAKNPEVVAPIPFDTDIDESAHTEQEAISLCANYSDESRLPNKHELSGLFYNKNLVGNFTDNGYWSSSRASVNSGWLQGMKNGSREKTTSLERSAYVRCIYK